MKLELAYPAKPYVVTQPWGEPNEAYLRFGFSKHNGIDFKVDTDGIVQAMCDGEVTQTGSIPTGAGNYVIYRTGPVECEGVMCLVYFQYMHAKEILVKTGDQIRVGDNLIVADNTGFSTGPHTHISAWRQDYLGNRLDLDTATNHTFDHSKYFLGMHAEDVFKHTFDTNMEYGDRGEEVKNVQRALKLIGYFPQDQEITGFYGPITRAAVFNFQKDYVSKLSKGAWIAVWMNWGRYCSTLTRGELNKMFA